MKNELYILDINNTSFELTFGSQYARKYAFYILIGSEDFSDNIRQTTNFDAARVRLEHKLHPKDDWQAVKKDGIDIIATTAPFTIENTDINIRDVMFRFKLENATANTKILLRVRFE